MGLSYHEQAYSWIESINDIVETSLFEENLPCLPPG